MKVKFRSFLAALAIAAMGVSMAANGQSTAELQLSDYEHEVEAAGFAQKAGGCNGCGAKDNCHGGCGAKGKGGCSCYLFGPDEPFKLFDSDRCCGIDFGGWVQVGYHTAGANDNGTGLFNNNPDRFQAHQLWAYLEKAADGSCGLDWGFRVDYVFGTDGQNTQAFGNPVGPTGNPTGWDNEWDAGMHYGSAIPQAYLQLAAQDVSVKVGHFYTIIGYEVVTAPDNFFYSHAITMNNNEPFTHTGVLAEWAVNDCVTVWGGWTLGWDTGFDENGGSSFLGGISQQLRDDLSITTALIVGDFGFNQGPVQGSDTNAFMTSTVIDWVVNDCTEIVIQYDFHDNDIFLGGTGQGHAINNYLFYTINDCLKWGVRGEWTKLGNNENSEITVGFNYRPHANMVLRPEVRWDLSNFVVPGVDRQDTTLFGIDCIVIW